MNEAKKKKLKFLVKGRGKKYLVLNELQYEKKLMYGK